MNKTLLNQVNSTKKQCQQTDKPTVNCQNQKQPVSPTERLNQKSSVINVNVIIMYSSLSRLLNENLSETSDPCQPDQPTSLSAKETSRSRKSGLSAVLAQAPSLTVVPECPEDNTIQKLGTIEDNAHPDVDDPDVEAVPLRRHQKLDVPDVKVRVAQKRWSKIKSFRKASSVFRKQKRSAVNGGGDQVDGKVELKYVAKKSFL